MKKNTTCRCNFTYRLAGYAQKTIVTDTAKPINGNKTSRLDFNVNLRTSHLWRGLVINDGMTATGYIHYAWTKLYRWFWEPDLMENTLK
jgi:hypothetical protein